MTLALTQAIAAEASAYTVTRFAAGTRTKGIYTPGASSTLSVSMTVQPMQGNEVQFLPEGLRNRELVKCHALAELRIANQGTGAAGDRFAYGGNVFEVVQVEDWSAFGGYWRAVAARVQA